MRVSGIAGLLLATCAVGACGDDKNSSGTPASADEKAVRAVVQEALTTTDPSSCTRLVTRELLEQTTQERGAAAIRSCRDDAENPGAKTLTIDEVRVSGPRASVDVRPRGGGLPFKTLTLGLRRAAGRWKVSRLKSGELDRAAFKSVLRAEFAKPPDSLPPAVSDCTLKELDGTSDDRLANAFIKADATVFLVPAALCGIRVALEQETLPPGVTDCILRDFRRELTTGSLGRRIARDPDALDVLDSPEGERLSESIGASCARQAGTTSG